METSLKGINRNIMEFKENRDVVINSFSAGINRNIMEFKEDSNPRPFGYEPTN